MREKYNLATFSQKTVARAKNTIDSSPAKSGPSQRYPLAAEKVLVRFILELRLLKLPTNAHSICNYAARLIKGTEWEDDFLSEDKEIIEIPIHWFYRFINSSQAEQLELSKNSRALEQVRHAWATAEHMKAHYDVVMKVLLQYGIAEKNPTYDEAVPHSRPIIVKKEHEHRVLSFDETHWTADMTETCRASQIKCEGRGMDVVSSKSSKTATLIGGSKMDGFALPMCAIFAGKQVDAAWIHDPPLTTMLNPATGEVYRPQFFPNESGGMTHDLGILILQHWIHPCCPDVSPENVYIIICDGHGSHLTAEFLQYAREHGFIIILRPPHSSHISQGEDVINFRAFKGKERAVKAEIFSAKMCDVTCKSKNLDYCDMTKCIKLAWERAFAPRKNRRAWSVIGLSPFTRKVFWDLQLSENRIEKEAREKGFLRISDSPTACLIAARMAQLEVLPVKLVNQARLWLCTEPQRLVPSKARSP
jgi:hypothetical protein